MRKKESQHCNCSAISESDDIKPPWYLNHRIREVTAEGAIPKLGGIVEIDETYIGGKQKGKGVYYGKKQKQKQVVVGLRERKGPLLFVHTKDAKANTLRAVISEHVGPDFELFMTDTSSAGFAPLKFDTLTSEKA